MTKPTKAELLVSDGGMFYTVFKHGNHTCRRYWVCVQCDACGKDLVSGSANYSKWGKAYCNQDCKNVSMTGPNNAKWGGGRKNKRGKSGGHILAYAPDHPFARKGYVPEHRLVVEASTGTILPSEIMVHHIDLDEQNNDLDNLIPVTQIEHNKLHWQLNKLVKGLMLAGVVSFDRMTQTYNLTKEITCQPIVESTQEPRVVLQ